MSIKNRYIPFLALTLLAGGSAVAGDKMSAEAVTKLISGNTVHVVRNKDGVEFKMYFSAEGVAQRLIQGKVKYGSWEVKPNGKHCINMGGKDKCAAVQDNGDGTYSRLNKRGKATVTWKKFENGKAF